MWKITTEDETYLYADKNGGRKIDKYVMLQADYRYSINFRKIAKLAM